MRRFITLLRRELGHFFHSPLAYVVLCFFLLLTGYNFHAGVAAINRGPSTVTVVEAFFNTVFFWFPFVLLFPLLTMRLFSEEYKMGTIETLMTAPVRDWEVVFSKYLAALVFFVVLWLPSLAYFFIFQWITKVQAAEAAGSYLGGYAMLFLIGMFYLSIGCFASALTKNQIVAGFAAFSLITLMFFLGLISMFFLSVSPALRDLTAYFSAIEHMMDYSRGLFDTRPLVFYTSMTAFMLFLTYLVFQARRWKA